METKKVNKIIEQLSDKLEERKVSDRRQASNADQFDNEADRRKSGSRRNVTSDEDA
ncbi:MAG: hypothetical protein JKY01_01645 [Pseudomonadales bacterium]|nr:hypothetical protein [Pseudomonadales bacterium]